MMVSPSYLAVILAALQAPTCLSWTFSTTNINLAYPPPLNFGYSVENDVSVLPYIPFPCGNVPVDPSQSRVPFPITQGTFTYTLSNTSIGSLKDYEYYVFPHLGQISLGNGSYSSSVATLNPGIAAGYAALDTEVWKNFATGCEYSYEYNATDLVNKALGTNYVEADLEGMNATWGLSIVLFAPNPKIQYTVLDDYNQEEMYQCGYVTFTNKDVPKSYEDTFCNATRAITPSSTSSSTATQSGQPIIPVTNSPPTKFSTSHTSSPKTTAASTYSTTASSSAAATAAVAVGSNSQQATHAVAVGTGVGVSMGASFLILAVALFFLRRRRARKARSGTIGPHVLVSPPLNDEELTDMKKSKVKEKASESSSSSVHSEPLPVYSEAGEGPSLSLKAKT